MDFAAMPRLRMEIIEGLKASILTHLGAAGSELGQRLGEQVDLCIATYDWEGQVKRIVHQTLTDRIEYYFQYGEGRDAVVAAVNEGFESALQR
jgi:hypothetical protein